MAPQKQSSTRPTFFIALIVAFVVAVLVLWRLFSSPEPRVSGAIGPQAIPIEEPRRDSTDTRAVNPRTAPTPWPVYPAATADPNETPLPTEWPRSTPDPSAPRETESASDDAPETGEASKDNDGN